jgi:sialic acid synthase SpsE
MVRDLNLVTQAMGDGVKQPLDTEKQPLIKMGKMIVYAESFPIGHVLTEIDLEIRSPMLGVSAQQWDIFVGKELKKSVTKHQPLKLEDFS